MTESARGGWVRFLRGVDGARAYVSSICYDRAGAYWSNCLRFPAQKKDSHLPGARSEHLKGLTSKREVYF